MSAPLDHDIPRFNRIVYASASFGGNLLSRTGQLWLLFYYAPPEDADLPTIIPRLWMAVILLAVEQAMCAVEAAGVQLGEQLVLRGRVVLEDRAVDPDALG